MTTVSSCRMIEALMYGMMPSAKIENCSSAPPENRFTRPSTESLHLVEELRQRLAVDARASGIDHADAVHGEHRRT